MRQTDVGECGLKIVYRETIQNACKITYTILNTERSHAHVN